VLGLGVAGAILIPLSGFWLLILQGAILVSWATRPRKRRKKRNKSELREPDTIDTLERGEEVQISPASPN